MNPGKSENEIEEQYREVSNLAAIWRGANIDHDFPLMEKSVKRYTFVIHHLLELGWDGYIDIDCELPDELMPEELIRFWEEKEALTRRPDCQREISWKDILKASQKRLRKIFNVTDATQAPPDFTFEEIIRNGDLENFFKMTALYMPFPIGRYCEDRLIKFYEDADTSNADKQEVRRVMKNMLEGPPLFTNDYVLQLGGLLGLDEIKSWVIRSVADNHLKKGDYQLDWGLTAAFVTLKIDEVKQEVLSYLIREKKVFYLFRVCPQFEEPEVSETELWSAAVLADHYQQANLDERREIEQQMKDMLLKYGKIQEIVRQAKTKRTDTTAV